MTTQPAFMTTYLGAGQAALRPDDFPTDEERVSGFPVIEYKATLESLWARQQEKQQLAQEDEGVLLALYKQLPKLQGQLTPPYGTRLESGKGNGSESRRIGGRVYEIRVPIAERG